ncbi:MAG: hypothetical protein H7A17_02650 [Sinobacteraceae bacterium]|nr:hypothetical protein [Nevskiaceae bacterium]MCP5340108.1 hypothetical protein [Nevskiaceae bacterium]MCP5359281.1 hypothetical protein [Nevskiaceae bacterium]MCP5466510.1 hypothetical protein [Nevskiaceae bacterium]
MTMRTAMLAAALCLAACASPEGREPAAATPAGSSDAPAAPATDSVPARGPMPQATAGAAARTLAGRQRELASPDNGTLVLLYYDLAGIAPPMDEWVERDTRVQFARPADKPARRAEVRAELQAIAQAVRDVGLLRLSTNANLSDYDPTYGEFTVRALAPSSVFEFEAFGQKASVRFGNGRDAQLWRVEAEEARAIRDRIGYGSVTLDALLVITGVQPAVQGGIIVTDVIEYEMRDSLRGQLVGRVQLSPR